MWPTLRPREEAAEVTGSVSSLRESRCVLLWVLWYADEKHRDEGLHYRHPGRKLRCSSSCLGLPDLTVHYASQIINEATTTAARLLTARFS